MSDEKKVLYIGNFILPDKNAAAHRVLAIGKALRECGIEVVYAGVTENKTKQDILLSKEFIQGFECYFRNYPKNAKEWMLYLTDITSYIEIIREKSTVDGVIFYNLSSYLMLPLMRYCRKKEIKCLADCTEWYNVSEKKILFKLVKGLDEFLRMRLLQKRMDGMIVISSSLKKYYRNCKNIIQIPPLVDIKEKKWKNTKESLYNGLLIAYVGNPATKDRVDYLINAIDGLNRNIRLDIVGITLEEYLKFYPKQRKILRGKNEIYFHGKLTHTEALNYVQNADYTCFFRNKTRSNMMGFPSKFVESVSCGTPVITNDTSDLKSFIKKGCGIIVESTKINDIQIALLEAPKPTSLNWKIFDYRNYVAKINEWARIVLY